MSSGIEDSWRKLDSVLAKKPGPILRQKSTNPSPPKLYRATTKWAPLQSIGKSVSSIKLPNPLTQRTDTEGTIPRSKSQPLKRDFSPIKRGKIVLKPGGGFEGEGFTIDDAERIFREKCEDLGIGVIGEQMQRFFEFCSRNVRNRRFCMEECGLGPNAARAIATLLKNNYNFSILDLGKNLLGDSGVLALMETFAKCTNLVHLGLSSNGISPECASAVLGIMVKHESITSLDLSSTEGLHRNRLGTSGSFSLIPLLTKNRILTSLNLAGTALGTEGAENLAAGLTDNKRLLVLNLGNNGLGGKALESLGRGLSSSQVRYLTLSENRLGLIGCQNIGNFVSGAWGDCPLVSLDLSKCEISFLFSKKLFSGLGQNYRIKTLNLDRNPLGAESNIELFEFFVENRSVVDLNLSSCDLKDEGILCVAEGLAKNATVSRLNLSLNFFEDAGAIALADGIGKNNTLTVVDLSGNRIHDAGGNALCASLKSNKTLETVLLRDNNIQDSSGKVLAEIVRRNRSLLKVGLDLNPINFKYLKEINRSASANRLRKKRTITPLLKSEIRSLRIPENAFDSIDREIEDKIKEQEMMEELLRIQQERFLRCQDEENEKFALVHNELESVLKVKLEKAKELFELKDLIALEIASGKKEFDEQENELFELAAEVNKLSKACKGHKGAKLKDSFAQKRVSAVVQLTKAVETKEEEIRAKEFAEFSLKAIREQIQTEAMNGQGESEEKKSGTNSAAEKPAIRKKTLRISYIEKSATSLSIRRPKRPKATIPVQN